MKIDQIKKCGFCRKILKRKKNYGGRQWEQLGHYKQRIFCNHRCATYHTNKALGNVIWSKEVVKGKFNSIKSENKYNSDWLRVNHCSLMWGIAKYWKRFIYFLVEIGQESKALYDTRTSYFTKQAKKLLKYWREEQNIKVGDVFEWSYNEDYVISDPRHHYKVIMLLCQGGILRRLRIGQSRGKGVSFCSKYKLISNGTGKF